jgi:hypothetical protein
MVCSRSIANQDIQTRFLFTTCLGAKALGGARFGLGGLFLAVFGRGGGFKGMQEAAGSSSDFVDGDLKG